MGCGRSSPQPPVSDPGQLAEAQTRLRAAPLHAHLDALRTTLSEPKALLQPGDPLYCEARMRPYNLDFRGFPLARTAIAAW